MNLLDLHSTRAPGVGGLGSSESSLLLADSGISTSTDLSDLGEKMPEAPRLIQRNSNQSMDISGLDGDSVLNKSSRRPDHHASGSALSKALNEDLSHMHMIEVKDSANQSVLLVSLLSSAIITSVFRAIIDHVHFLFNFRSYRARETLTELAMHEYEQFQLSNKLEALDKAIDLFRSALTSISPVHDPDRWQYQSNLANAIVTRSEQTGRMEDLEEAIKLHRQVLLLCPASHEERPVLMCNLAGSLHRMYERASDREYLDEAITLSEEALRLCSISSQHRSAAFEYLALTLFERFKESDSQADIDNAITYNRNSIALRPAPHPHRLASLNNLANTLRARYIRYGEKQDIEEAVDLRRESLKLDSPQSPSHCLSLHNLATNLVDLFQIYGDRKYLDEAIITHREALLSFPASHPGRLSSLNGLAIALLTRFEQFGAHSDLEECISRLREVLILAPTPSPKVHIMALHNLANALFRRFKQSNELEDLEETIVLRRATLHLWPTSHPDRPDSESHLGHALQIRFLHLKQQTDLDEAIFLHKEAVSRAPSPHPRHFIYLNLYTAALLIRAETFGLLLEEEVASREMNEIIRLLREALVFCPYPRSLITLRNNLANALLLKFKQYSGAQEDYEEALSLFQQSVDDGLSSGAPSLSATSANLARALLQRREQYQEIAEFILKVNNLTNRFQLEPDMAESSLASKIHQLTAAYPSLASISENIGAERIENLPPSELENIDDAVAAFKIAASSTSSSIISRFQAAKTWAYRARFFKHSSALDAFQQAMSFVPMLASLGHNLVKRQQILAETDYHSLARDAALCAISSGSYDTAIELIEAGRAVIWMQTLRLHTPVNDLAAINPKLAERLSRISKELERGSHRPIGIRSDENIEKQAEEKQASHFTHLYEEWIRTIEEIRSLDGFNDFLLPKRLAKLQAAAESGPIIILIPSESGSDALVMTSARVQHITLPRMPLRFARMMASKIQKTVKHASRKNSARDSAEYTDRKGRIAGRKTESSIKEVLKVLWETVVQPVIDALDLKKSECPSNIIRWCPTGIFSFLPLHAAGIYRADMSSIDSIFDYAISSYTPTIGALLSHNSKVPTTKFKMLATIESKTLPQTVEELKMIKKYVSSDCLVTLGVPGSPASVTNVLEHISDALIVHFACHGKQDTENALESALTLEDADLKISQIMQKSMPNAALAFLCACETAMGDDKLPDENLHLGATLLYSGFSAVIATMWSIDDGDGPVVADAFYGHLFDGNSSSPDIKRAAQAIHIATIELRLKGASFQRWVPFIYLGT